MENSPQELFETGQNVCWSEEGKKRFSDDFGTGPFVIQEVVTPPEALRRSRKVTLAHPQWVKLATLQGEIAAHLISGYYIKAI